MRNLLVAITISLVLCGCKKETETVVTGRVSDAYSGEPVSGATLEFAYSQLKNGNYSTGYTDLGSITCDASGEYSFAFKNVSAVNYRVRLRKDGYLFRELIINQDEWRRSQENTFDPTMFLEASIRFRFYNSTSPQHQVLFSLNDHSEGCTSCCTTKSISIQGITDTVFSCAVYGNQIIGYELNRITPGESNVETGTIKIGAGENLLEINFQ